MGTPTSMNGDIDRDLSPCPSDLVLSRALEEPGDESDSDRLESHIQNCHACQQRLARLTDDPILQSINGALTDDSTISSESLLRWLKLLDPSCDEPANARDHPEMDSITFPGDPTPDAPLGRLEQFCIIEQIGSGGAGLIYRAIDTTLGRTVAIKVLRPHIAATVAGRTRFEREARLAARVRHDNVVSVLRVGETSASHQAAPLVFIVMEYVDGESLAELRRRRERLSPAEACRIMRQVALGLSAVHAHGLVHRDLKTSNIIVERGGGKARLLDFGIARALDSDASADHVTSTGQLLGTWEYMSPEQFDDSRRVDCRSDIFGFGVVLYELLTGRRPFQGSRPEVIRKIIELEPCRPSQVVRRLPSELDAIVLKCLDKNPARRYQTAEALAEDLGRWLVGEPILAKRPSTLRVCWKWAKRRPGLAALGVLALMPFIGWMGSLVWYSARVREREIEVRRMHDAAALERDRLKSQRQYTTLADTQRLLQFHDYDEARNALQNVPFDRRGWEFDWLNHLTRQAPRAIERVGNHDWPVAALLITSDEKTLVSSGHDGRVIAWDRLSGRSTVLETGTFSDAYRGYRHFSHPFREEPIGVERPDWLADIAWLREDAEVVGVSQRGKVVCWNLDGNRRRQLFSHNGPLTAIAVDHTKRRLLAGDERGTLVLLDAENNSRSAVEHSVGSAVLKIAYLGDDHWLIGESNGTLSVVDPINQTAIASTRLKQPVWSFDVIQKADGFSIYACFNTQRIVEYRWKAGAARFEELTDYDIPPDADGRREHEIQSIHVAAAADRLYAMDEANRLRTWKLDSPELLLASSGSWNSFFSVEDSRARPWIVRRRVTSMHAARGGELLYSGGADTAIVGWSVNDRQKPYSTWNVGVAPRVVADSGNDHRFWVGTSDGRLALWDSKRGTRITDTPAHTDAITCLAAASNSGIVATCDANRTIRYWRFVDGKIARVGNELRTSTIARSIALDPNGERVAIVDCADVLTIWDTRTSTKIGERALCDPSYQDKRTVSGCVGFNCDGTKLVAFGPSQSSWIFDSELRHEGVPAPYVAGDGGTALAWHPTDPTKLVVGDTIGRVVSHGFAPRHGQLGPATGWCVGLAFSTNADRIAALARDGSIAISDPTWIGPVLRIGEKRDDANAILFRGRALLTFHDDGTVIKREAVRDEAIEQASQRPIRPWVAKELLKGDDSLELDLSRRDAIAFDQHNRLIVAMTRPIEANRRASFIWRETETGFDEYEATQASVLHASERDTSKRTLTLLRQGDTLFAWMRQPSAKGTAPFLATYQLPSTGAPILRSIERIEGVAEDTGFDAHLIMGTRGKPDIVHFSHAGHFLFRERFASGGWQHERLGQWGDGLGSSACVDNDHRAHLTMYPTRFNGDLSPLTYLIAGVPGSREIVDPLTAGMRPSHQHGVAAFQNGHPAVLYSRFARDGFEEVVCAQRGPAGWTLEVVCRARLEQISDLVCDAKGRLHFVYVDVRTRRILLATRREKSTWEFEPIWEVPARSESFSAAGLAFNVVLLMDSTNRPVLIVIEFAPTSYAMHVLRPPK